MHTVYTHANIYYNYIVITATMVNNVCYVQILFQCN